LISAFAENTARRIVKYQYQNDKIKPGYNAEEIKHVMKQMISVCEAKLNNFLSQAFAKNI